MTVTRFTGLTGSLLLASCVLVGPLQVAVASATTATATATPALYAWGGNYRGERGDGQPASTAVRSLVTGLPPLRDVSAGDLFSLAADTDGHVWGWGNDSWGQLGFTLASGYDQPRPVQVPGLENVVDVEAAMHAGSAAVSSDGSVRTWGCLRGDGDDGLHCSPTPHLVSELPPVRQISGGGEHWLALTTTGEVWTWGVNEYGQLGDGSRTDQLRPERVEGLSNVVAVAAGARHSVALTADGVVHVWGANDVDQLGQGDGQEGLIADRPIAVAGLGGVTAVAVGWEYTVVLRSDGTMYGWGRAPFSTLGNAEGFSVTTPMLMPIDHVTSVEAGGGLTLVTRSDGSIWSMGVNDAGELGQGSITPPTSRYSRPNPAPVPVVGLHDVSLMSVGQDDVLAVGVADPLPQGSTPEAPTEPGLSVGDGTATLTWSPPASDGGLPVTGYTASVPGYDQTQDGLLVAHGPIRLGPDSRSATFHLPNGTPLFVTGVTASNAAGTSALAAESGGMAVGQPAPVDGVSATGGNREVTVAWQPANGNGAPVSGYDVVRGSSQSYEVIGHVPAGQTSFVLTEQPSAYWLCPGTQYSVRASNTWGTSRPLDFTGTVRAACEPVPGPAPSAVAGDASATVTWGPAYERGSPVTGYDLLRGSIIVATTGPDDRHAALTGLINGDPYQFTVVAHSALGDSQPSNTSTMVYPRHVTYVPAAPTSVHATAHDGGAVVSWLAPVSDGGMPLYRYDITDAQTSQFLASTAPGATQKDVTSLVDGRSYNFLVTAVNANGSGPASEPSNAVTPAPPASVPAAPAGTVAKAGDGYADVSWAPAADGGAPVTGYSVVVTPGGRRLDLPAVTTTRVSGLMDETAYTFTVAATNSVGSGLPSAPSGAVTPRSPIGVHYQELGGSRSALGAPLGPERAVVGGRELDYAHGRMYWSAGTGAHELHGTILSRYLTTGGPNGILGFPLTDESASLDRIGRYNTLTGGRIYWTSVTGAHEVHGAILSRWLSLGAERGRLAYPVSDEQMVTSGRRSDFRHGSVTWVSRTGALQVAYR